MKNWELIIGKLREVQDELEHWFAILRVSGRDRERCGYVDIWGCLIELPNRSARPSECFRIDNAELVADTVTEAGDELSLLAIWHTHPQPFDGYPSDLDRESLPLGYLGLVLHIETGTIIAFDQTRTELLFTLKGKQ